MLWDMPPRTKAKYDILTRYLQAWFAILAQDSSPGRFLYIDGFAGPGEYRDGEPGSPMLVLDVILQHQLFSRITRPGMDLVFVFIESDLARFTNLQQKLMEYEFPLNMHVSPVRETFEDYLGAQLRGLENQHLSLTP